VIAWAVDRLLRKPIEMEHLIDLVDGATRLRVVTCQGMLNLETPEGRAAARVQAAFARQEADQKGLRQHLSEQQAVERGRPPRRRAFGYRRGGLEVEPAEGGPGPFASLGGLHWRVRRARRARLWAPARAGGSISAADASSSPWSKSVGLQDLMVNGP
jgi:hypothetical protein